MSPRRTARLAGCLYLVIIVIAPLSEFFIRGRLAVGAPAVMATNILGSEPLYRLGGAIDFVVLVCDVSLALLLYMLLRPAGVGVSLLAAFFRLVFSAIQAVGMLFHFAPLVLLKHALPGLAATQAQALSALSLRLHDVVYDIALLFFGVHCLLIGWLVTRSGFLPRLIGVLLVIAGAGYLVNSSASLFFPALYPVVFPWALLPGLAGEGGLTLWLLVAGVDATRWTEEATAAEAAA